MTDRKQPQSTTEYLTPQQVAEELKISTDTVMRRFSKEPGVLDLGTPETCHQRRYRVLRIPRSALDRVIQASRVATAPPVRGERYTSIAAISAARAAAYRCSGYRGDCHPPHFHEEGIAVLSRAERTRPK